MQWRELCAFALGATGFLNVISLCAQTLEDAERFIKSQHYGAALAILRPLSQAGITDAQVILGMMYAEGKGVPEQPIEAVRWLRHAASKGNNLASEMLSGEKARRHSLYFLDCDPGSRNSTQEDLSRQTRLGLQWFLVCAHAGTPDCQGEVAGFYLRGTTLFRTMKRLPGGQGCQQSVAVTLANFTTLR